MADDSLLSITANIIGILTFAIALIAGFYARAVWLKSKFQSDLDISDACGSLDEYLLETAVLEHYAFSNPIAQSCMESIYTSEIHLIWIFTRLVRQSTVRRIKEWGEVRQDVNRELRNIENLHNRIRWNRLEAQLACLST